MRSSLWLLLAGLLIAVPLASPGNVNGHQDGTELDAIIESLMPSVIGWRHDIHQHPELSNREHRTAAKVAEHLRSIGLDEVETGIAHTGVVGTLVGGLPGPVVALRADMDGLPVKEMTGLPFASEATGEYNGAEVPVMHACGHDAHVAILMGVAAALAEVRASIPGTVKFFFQPAEEGAPVGEKGGAALMLEEGVFDGPDTPEVIFALHVWPEVGGTLGYRSGGTLAASDGLYIKVIGRQTHGSSPWRGVDPVIAAAQVMVALQTIPSRQLDITRAPAVVTIGSIHGGVRGNIIPDFVEMTGTVRTFDPNMREEFLERIRTTAVAVAEASGAVAEVVFRSGTPVTYNDPDLTERMLPTLERAAAGKVKQLDLIMGAEDFAFFLEHIPGFYFTLGVNKEGVGPNEAAANHSPYFYVNDEALVVGVRAMAGMAMDYLGARNH